MPASLGELLAKLGSYDKQLKKILESLTHSLRLTEKQIALEKLNIELINYAKSVESKACEQYVNEQPASAMKYEIDGVRKQITSNPKHVTAVGSIAKDIVSFTNGVFLAKSLLGSLVNLNLPRSNTSRKINTSTDGLQKLTEDASSNRFAHSIINCEKCADIVNTGVNYFNTANIEVLEQLRKKLIGLNNLMPAAGFDTRLKPIIRLSKQKLEDLYSTLQKYQLPSDRQKQISDFNVQLQFAAAKLQYSNAQEALAIMPVWPDFKAFKNGRDTVIEHFISGWTYMISYINSTDFSMFDGLKHELNWLSKIRATGEEPKLGYWNVLPKFNPNPHMHSSYQSSVINNEDNKQIHQNIQISTNQPAQSIQEQIAFANYTFATA